MSPSSPSPSPEHFFDEVAIGAEYVSGNCCVSREHIAQFANLSMDDHPLHTSEQFCTSQGFDGLVAHGLLGLALMGGLKARMKIYAPSAAVSLGWDKVRFRKVILAGDTVSVRVKVVDKRCARDGARGIVRQHVEMINQHGETVTEAEHVSLVKRDLDRQRRADK